MSDAPADDGPDPADGLQPVRRALLSVSDKDGIVGFARGLAAHGVALVSTGGTFRTLKDAGLEVAEVADLTGFPEMLGGRVKTLHPKVHGGLLFDRDDAAHVATAAEHGIEPIDMVVVNLYPFEETVSRPGVSLAEAVEKIDIGGPSMIRSAAKNHSHVAVVTGADEYEGLLEELEDHDGQLTLRTRVRLATNAFIRTAEYDDAIAVWFGREYFEPTFLKPDPPAEDDMPGGLDVGYDLLQTLRYGENPHQPAAFYADPTWETASVATAEKLHGKELSYNNILDLDAALGMVREFDRPAAMILKHNNPCGAAVADDLAEAFAKAQACDPTSAFGSIVGLNRPVDAATAEQLTEPDRFVEAVIAPSFSDEAFRILTTRPTWRKSVRLLACGDMTEGEDERRQSYTLRPVEGGALYQQLDWRDTGWDSRQCVTKTQPTPEQLRDLQFAWRMVKHVRSNAILLAANEATVGIGAGQMSRVDATDLAIKKAGARAAGSVLASDAFFPFRDNVDAAAAAGIAAIVQPGGSKRDAETIAACDEHGLAMLFTGVRHFKH